jgi:hypothetical protein
MLGSSWVAAWVPDLWDHFNIFNFFFSHSSNHARRWIKCTRNTQAVLDSVFIGHASALLFWLSVQVYEWYSKTGNDAAARRFGLEFNKEETRKLENLYFFSLQREWEGKSCISFFTPYLCHTCQRSGLHSNLFLNSVVQPKGTAMLGQHLRCFQCSLFNLELLKSDGSD